MKKIIWQAVRCARVEQKCSCGRSIEATSAYQAVTAREEGRLVNLKIAAHEHTPGWAHPFELTTPGNTFGYNLVAPEAEQGDQEQPTVPVATRSTKRKAKAKA